MNFVTIHSDDQRMDINNIRERNKIEISGNAFDGCDVKVFFYPEGSDDIKGQLLSIPGYKIPTPQQYTFVGD